MLALHAGSIPNLRDTALRDVAALLEQVPLRYAILGR